jgi:hypothetical protein
MSWRMTFIARLRNIGGLKWRRGRHAWDAVGCQLEAKDDGRLIVQTHFSK